MSTSLRSACSGKTRQIRNAVSTGIRDGMCTIESSLSDLVARGVVTYDDAVALAAGTPKRSRLVGLELVTRRIDKEVPPVGSTSLSL